MRGYIMFFSIDLWTSIPFGFYKFTILSVVLALSKFWRELYLFHCMRLTFLLYLLALTESTSTIPSKPENPPLL